MTAQPTDPRTQALAHAAAAHTAAAWAGIPTPQETPR